MKYKLTVTPETLDGPWWPEGGAMLWHEFGGGNSATLVLTEDEFEEFERQAKQIEGWQDKDAVIDGVLYGGDVAIVVEEDHDDDAGASPTQTCCRRCNLPFHSSLKSVADMETVPVPRRELNHVLIALEEAVDLTRGMAPHMGLAWNDALKELVEAIERPRTDSSLSPPVIQEKDTSQR
ncbi:MAG: hypothetical protein HY914_23280 [Desulfomonile tiedjei]|nr:hypothetical protein [Desulfomonile tiedjei]